MKTTMTWTGMQRRRLERWMKEMKTMKKRKGMTRTAKRTRSRKKRRDPPTTLRQKYRSKTTMGKMRKTLKENRRTIWMPTMMKMTTMMLLTSKDLTLVLVRGSSREKISRTMTKTEMKSYLSKLKKPTTLQETISVTGTKRILEGTFHPQKMTTSRKTTTKKETMMLRTLGMVSKKRKRKRTMKRMVPAWHTCKDPSKMM
mmetsp:Transcript_24130/g.95051  ORF Transcript_24130/g.95051 Transcript_24130/m.95051 type:complete len:200 (+) Transcript_24130:29-628(+)